MQDIISTRLITPVRRIPPSWACHGTSAPINGVFGVMGTADYAALRRAT